MLQQGIIKGDALQKLSGIGLIVGAILLVVLNILFPRASDPASAQQWLEKWGERETLTQVIALLIAVSFWAMMIGMAGVYRAISAGGAAWVRLGFYGIIVGTTIWTVGQALTMATAGAAAEWLAATTAGQAAAYSVAAALYATASPLFSMGIIVYWLALFFVGIGMLLSTVYPKWLGWVGLLLGIVTAVAVGVVQALVGLGTTTGVLFAVLMLLTTLWGLVLGIWVTRKAW